MRTRSTLISTLYRLCPGVNRGPSHAGRAEPSARGSLLRAFSKAGIRVQISKITGMTSGRFCVCLEM
jgi:hypothetical protein